MDWINSGHSISPIGLWTAVLRFLEVGRRHLGFLEPEVTIFGREASSLAIPDDYDSTELAASSN